MVHSLLVRGTGDVEEKHINLRIGNNQRNRNNKEKLTDELLLTNIQFLNAFGAVVCRRVKNQ